MVLMYILILYFLMLYLVFTYLVGKDKYRKLQLFLSLFPLFILSSLRAVEVGNDTYAYESLFINLSNNIPLASYSGRYEKLFLYLVKFSTIISDNFQILLILTSVYIYYAFARFIYDYSTNILISVIIFFTFRYFDLSMSEMRQVMAIATILLSFRYLVQNRIILFIIFVLIGYGFHTSAIVFLLALPVSKIKNKSVFRLYTVIGLLVLYNLMPLLINSIIRFLPQYSGYLSSTYFDGVPRLATILLIVLNSLLYIIGEYVEPKSANTSSIVNTLSSNFVIISIVFLVMSIQGTILSRFTHIFGVFMIIYIPNQIGMIRDRNHRFLYSLLVISIVVVYVIVVQILRPEWQSTYPYTFCTN